MDVVVVLKREGGIPAAGSPAGDWFSFFPLFLLETRPHPWAREV